MNRKLYLILFIFIGTLVIFSLFYVNKFNHKAQIKKLNLRGESQVCLDFNSNSGEMLYLSVDSFNKTLITNIFIKDKKRDILVSNFLYAGFLNDSTILCFDKKNIYAYNYNTHTSLIIDTMFLDINDISFETVKVGVYNSSYGFYYLRNNNVYFYDVINKSKTSIFLQIETSLKLISFDVHALKLLLCFEEQINNNIKYNYYLFDLKERKNEYVFSSDITDFILYKPIVRILNGSEFVTNFYSSKNVSFLQKINILKKKKVFEYKFKKHLYFINTNVSGNETVYLSLFDDSLRNSKNYSNKDIAIALFTGINIYKFTTSN